MTQFAKFRKISLTDLADISVSEILQFIASLYDRRISLSTARVYIAGLSNFLRECAFPDTTDTVPVRHALRGYARLAPSAKDPRMPITLNHMRIIKAHLISSTSDRYEQALYWCACTFAFFGFLRVSEFTVSKYTNHSLRFADVRLFSEYVQLHIPSSKTDQFSHGAQMNLHATKRSACPVRAFRKYSALRPATLPPESPVFVLRCGSYLTRKMFDRFIQSVFPRQSGTPKISSHSFRIGAATAAASRGNPVELIQKSGRWKSDAFARYVRDKVPITAAKIY